MMDEPRDKAEGGGNQNFNGINSDGMDKYNKMDLYLMVLSPEWLCHYNYGDVWDCISDLAVIMI